LTTESAGLSEQVERYINACEVKVKEQQENFDLLNEIQARSTQQCEHFSILMPTAIQSHPSAEQLPHWLQRKI
jgi:hypothetical protein